MPRKNITKIKHTLIASFGGACQRCGYNRCLRALHFHHHDASEKQEWSGKRGNASLDEIATHPERFTLLCANCHAEVHDEETQARQILTTCIGCGKQFPTHPARSKGNRDKFCSRQCYARNRVLIAKPLEERFWKHVDTSGDCWVWTGYRDKQGAGRAAGRNGSSIIPAARVSWEIAHGTPPPRTQLVLHTCKNPACVNPAHLYLGSHKDRPTRVPRPGYKGKVTTEMIREIRARYAAGGISQKTLGAEYELSQGTICAIVRRTAWAHID